MQEHILVVDDEATVRGIMAALLEHSGYSAATAASADEAIAYLQHNPRCDLVLCDVMLPEADGFTLLDRIGADHPGMPVVMLTGVRDVHVATRAFRRGAVDYVIKPFDHGELMGVVGRAVEHGSRLRQNAAYRQDLEKAISLRTHSLRATMKELEKSYDVTIEAMSHALDLRDTETEGHSRRVTAYTIALAREVGVTDEDLRVIARGAFLHDIGKIATPDSILLKPGGLDPEELEIMREHCGCGYQMVRKIPFLRAAAEIVYAHQENFDGSGYPRGLRGEEIPLGARIFAVADTLDAMTSDRPYRKALSFEETREEIARYSGRQFDPRVVDVFLRMPRDLWSELRQQVQNERGSVFGVLV